MEKDSMGEMEVPAGAYYGASTQRAVLNFPISSQALPRRFIRALGLVKRAAAQTNLELGLLSRRRARAIAAAAQQVIDGELDGHFPIDVYQTGSGTSSNNSGKWPQCSLRAMRKRQKAASSRPTTMSTSDGSCKLHTSTPVMVYA